MQGFKITVFGINKNFIRHENCECCCFSCNLNAFVSQFQHSRFRALCNYFQARRSLPPTKSEGACTPMLVVVRNKQIYLKYCDHASPLNPAFMQGLDVLSHLHLAFLILGILCYMYVLQEDLALLIIFFFFLSLLVTSCYVSLLFAFCKLPRPIICEVLSRV